MQFINRAWQTDVEGVIDEILAVAYDILQAERVRLCSSLLGSSLGLAALTLWSSFV